MTPAYSVIIPAYNEEDWLPRTLTALQAAMNAVEPPGEVIVVDNHSTDGTARVAETYGARVVFEPVNQIARARNAGARIAQGAYFIFLDADTIASADLLRAALANLASGACCGGGALVAMEGDISRVARHGVWCWNRISVTFRLAAGCFVYCLREAFEAVGGFDEKLYASEEVWLSHALRRWGRKRSLAFRIITEPQALTSSRKLQWFSPPQLFFMMLVMTLCPFAVRIRALCSFWYTRPPRR